VYGLFNFLDVHELWPWSRGLAVFSGVLATVALLYMEAFATEAISFPNFLIGSGVIFVAGALIYMFAPQGTPPFKIVGSIPFWGRRFEQVYKGPDSSRSPSTGGHFERLAPSAAPAARLASIFCGLFSCSPRV